MASEWPEALLGELVQNFDSRRIPLSSREREKRRGQYPYYGATGIMDYVDDFLFEGLHLLVAEDGSVERPDGKPFLQLVDGRFWVNNHAHVLRGSTDEDTRFLYYALSTVAIRPYMSGSVQAKLSQGNLNRIPTPYPADPADRRAIAYILGTLDDKIGLNRRMNETLEAMARALFRSWFVDFDPVRAKAEGRDPGLPKPIADLFPARLVNSELGEIPVGWEVGSILEQSQLLSGGTPKTDREQYWSGSIPWASAKDVSQCGESFLVTTERAITEMGLEESSTQLIPAFATAVVARGATTGRMALLGRQMAMNQTCYALVSKFDTPFTLHCMMRNRIADLVHAAHGSVFDTITTRTFETTRFLQPPLAALRAFEHLVTSPFERVLAASEEIRALSALRDTLLPMLISGSMRVKDTEKFLEKAG
jgi:type I restriction enzyme S subunit